MYNVQALLKPYSRSAVTSTFFLSLAQGISRGALEEGHNTAGEEEIDEASLRPQREGESQSSGIPKGEQAVFVLMGLWSRDPSPDSKGWRALATGGRSGQP